MSFCETGQSSYFIVSGSSATSFTEISLSESANCCKTCAAVYVSFLLAMTTKSSSNQSYIISQNSLQNAQYSRPTLDLCQLQQPAATFSVIGRPHDPALLLVESGIVGVAKYLKSPLLNYDVLATAAQQPGIYSLGRRASSCSWTQYTYRDDARRHDSSQGVNAVLFGPCDVDTSGMSSPKLFFHSDLLLQVTLCWAVLQISSWIEFI